MEGAFPSNTVTLEVTPEGALALGAAGTQGALGLALIGRAEEADTLSVVKTEPKRVIVRRSPTRTTAPRTTNVRVINGDKETQVDAPVSKPKTLTEEAS
jgi:pilus assembly protein CpaB